MAHSLSLIAWVARLIHILFPTPVAARVIVASKSWPGHGCSQSALALHGGRVCAVNNRDSQRECALLFGHAERRGTSSCSRNFGAKQWRILAESTGPGSTTTQARYPATGHRQTATLIRWFRRFPMRGQQQQQWEHQQRGHWRQQ